jgi:CarD family transcriptional regulator
MFQINDYIIYGGNGVCRVKEIGTLDLGGVHTDKLFYTLEPVYTKGSMVYTPVDNKKVLMRKIISRGDALKVIDEIPEIETIAAAADRQREEEYKRQLNLHECRGWIKIIKTLNLRTEERNAEGKKLNSTDERYLRVAESNLFGELAISLEIPKEKVEAFIADRMKQSEIV